jgi:heat shock protein HslJ
VAATAPLVTTPSTSETIEVATTTAATTSTILPAAPAGLDGLWRASSGTANGAPVELIDEAPITLLVEGDTLSGTAACNGYRLTGAVSDSTIDIVGGSINEAGCELAVMDLEAIYFDSLRGIAAYAIDGTTLTLQTPTATWIFEYVPPVPPAPLVGTTWILNGVIFEFGAFTSAGIEIGRIVFDHDGTFAGSTGCREFTGAWTLDGGRITTREVSIIGQCTGLLIDVDEIAAQVLTEGFTVSIEGTHLAIRARADLGLDFLAVDSAPTDGLEGRSDRATG